MSTPFRPPLSNPHPRTFSLTVREMLASPPSPGFVRLAEVDGLVFPDPLGVEQIRPTPEGWSDPDDPSVDITVWSPKGWMFGINLAPQAQGGREIIVKFVEA